MMKKFFGILLTLAMVLSLAACGGSGGSGQADGSGNPPASTDNNQPGGDAPSGSAGGTFKLGGVGPQIGRASCRERV